MEFCLLASVELRVDGQKYELGDLKTRHVLAILLSQPRRPVTIETLIDRLWGGAPPGNARGNIYSYIARLRRLQRLSGGEVRLIREPGVYTLDVDPDRVDFHRFKNLHRQARAIAESGDVEAALHLLREAESLWRGTPLADLSGEWVKGFRRQAESEYRLIIGLRLSLELQLGRHAELIGELYGLIVRYPEDESFVEHLMVALYRCGRQADALEAYHQARVRLGEMGIDPSPRLRAVYERILQGDPELVVPAPPARGPERSRPNGLPYDTPVFTGRERELHRLYAATESVSPTVIIEAIDGMSGVGKSALAIHAAHRLADRYPEGRLYLNLHAHHPEEPPLDPAIGLETLLRELGENPERIPPTLEQRAALWRMRLAGKRVLVVLDDAADADQVRPFLPGAAGCLMLITSRRRLTELEGVHAISLGTLEPHEAALLFRRIVGEERKLDAREIARLVQLCGYLPLAITIMASKLRHRPARGVGDLIAKLSRLQKRLTEIRAGGKNLVRAFDLSYRELPPRQRLALRRLGVHFGVDLTVEAAAALIDCDRGTAEAALEELIDYHLLEEHSAGRVRFHDLLRDYARDRMAKEEPAEESDLATRRLLDFYLHTVELADRTLSPHRRRAQAGASWTPLAVPSVDDAEGALTWLRAEYANLLACVRYAAEHGLARQCIALAQSLATYLDRAARWEDATWIHETALRCSRELGDATAAADLEVELSLALGRMGRYADAFMHVNAGLNGFRRLADRIGECKAQDGLARLNWLSGHNQDALSHARRAVEIARETGDRPSETNALLHQGIALSYLGRMEEAETVFEEAQTIARETNDIATEAMLLNNLGELQKGRGNHAAALDLFHQSLATLRRIGSRQNIAVALSNIATAHRDLGRLDEALHFYRQALPIFGESGDRRNEADTLNSIGHTYLRSEKYPEALIHFQRALTIAQEIEEPYGQARALHGIGEVRRNGGQLAVAEECFRRALRLAQGLADPYIEGLCLWGLGETLNSMRGRGEAEEFWRRACRIFDQLGAPEGRILRRRLESPEIAG